MLPPDCVEIVIFKNQQQALQEIQNKKCLAKTILSKCCVRSNSTQIRRLSPAWHVGTKIKYLPRKRVFR